MKRAAKQVSADRGIKTLSAIIGHVSSATTLNVYAPTKAECEEKLAQLIVQMKEEIAGASQSLQKS